MIDTNKEKKDQITEEGRWYVVHTYSGYENKVKANIEKLIENRKLQDQIMEITVPMHKVLEEKNGAKKEVEKKLFPGYVIVKMIMTDETWYVVRNTRGVTGFVGPGSKPIPLTEEELVTMGLKQDTVKLDIEIGDTITVIEGPFEGSVGIIKEIHEHKQTVIVNLSIFGRETPVELSFFDMEKV